MHTLVVVESPAKARTIQTFLPTSYRVMACKGHIRDLPRGRLGVSATFEPEWVVLPDRQETVTALEEAVRSVQTVVLATDPDREGEAIAWHLECVLAPVTSASFRRARFHEITQHAVLHALQNTTEIDRHQVDAQIARRVVDRLIGFEVSPRLWKAVKRGASAGRVQSTTVRALLDHTVQPADWVMEFTLVQGSHTLTLTSEAMAEDAAHQGVERPMGSTLEIVRRLERTTDEMPPPPVDTAGLILEAEQRWGMRPQVTMRAAQDLFEGVQLSNSRVALITYPRTDSHRVSSPASGRCHEWLAEHRSAMLPSAPRGFAAAAAHKQSAHEAIRPCDVSLQPRAICRQLTRERARVYAVVWDRFVSSHSRSASWREIRLDTRLSTGAQQFTLRILADPGFRAHGRRQEAPQHVPEQGERWIVQNARARPLQGQLTEGALIARLATAGVGRPSTWVGTLAALQARGYTTRDEQQHVVATPLAVRVDQWIREHVPWLTSPETTARLESMLDDVAAGRLGWRDVVQTVAGWMVSSGTNDAL